ncbi:hypothetical protein [Streptomyces sp. NPDC057694]|uniref:hypothetical protein n=1 Tax=Streptomyces sp. NPDC057694 TaxID=3346216 RepID=UPI003674A204
MVHGLVVLTGAGLIWTVVRLLHYPGRWEHLFGSRHQKQRRGLAQARGTLRALQISNHLEMGRAHGNVMQARSQYRRRIARIEQRIERLNDPGPGPYEDELGPLVRHTRVLIHHGRHMNLAGVRLWHEPDRHLPKIYLYITEADGSEHLEILEQEHCDEERLRRFCVATHAAAAKEDRNQQQRREELRAAEEELADAREATDPIEQAEQDRNDTRTHHQNQPRLPQARKALDDARDAWQQLTGHRPLL